MCGCVLGGGAQRERERERAQVKQYLEQVVTDKEELVFDAQFHLKTP